MGYSTPLPNGPGGWGQSVAHRNSVKQGPWECQGWSHQQHRDKGQAGWQHPQVLGMNNALANQVAMSGQKGAYELGWVKWGWRKPAESYFILKDLEHEKNKTKFAFYKGHSGRTVKDKLEQGETRDRERKQEIMRAWTWQWCSQAPWKVSILTSLIIFFSVHTQTLICGMFYF
jgi:hypothetical protein